MKRVMLLGGKVILFTLIFTIGLQAQKDDELLKRTVEIDPSFNANIWSAVHVLADQGIPIGFEAAEHWNVDMGPKLCLKSGSLSEVLKSISQQDPGYVWQENDGVINFFPSADRNVKSLAALETRIGPTTVNKGDSRAYVVEQLSRLFDEAGGKKLQFHSAVGAGNNLGIPDKFDKQIDIPKSDTRTVLNRLIKAQAFSPIWSVMQYAKRDELILVF